MNISERLRQIENDVRRRLREVENDVRRKTGLELSNSTRGLIRRSAIYRFKRKVAAKKIQEAYRRALRLSPTKKKGRMTRSIGEKRFERFKATNNVLPELLSKVPRYSPRSPTTTTIKKNSPPPLPKIPSNLRWVNFPGTTRKEAFSNDGKTMYTYFPNKNELRIKSGNSHPKTYKNVRFPLRRV